MLLDEPTSALDGASEVEILAALRKVSVDRAIVMVSHRLSLARTADRILFLDGGEFVEQGSHAQLIANRGPYAELWDLQHESPAPAHRREERGRVPHFAAWETGRG